tara:strand:+ start:794 stop:1324 length:531 start_codon:yes stop_codon:yes gene_type:complete
MEYIYNAKDFDSAVEIDNYPWGFRLRTKVRYWIETTKRGDRFVKQTLNPKTDKWCKPKKSTYSAVLVMTKTVEGDKTFIRSVGIDIPYSSAEIVCGFENEHKDKLSQDQIAKICEAKAIHAVNEFVEVEIVKTTNLTKEEREKRDQEQKEIKEKLNNMANHLFQECMIKNNTSKQS